MKSTHVSQGAGQPQPSCRQHTARLIFRAAGRLWAAGKLGRAGKGRLSTLGDF